MQDQSNDRPEASFDHAGERRGTEGVIFDIARKAVASSVRSLLSSEDGLRALIGAMVPKEVGQTIIRELSTQLATLRTEAVNAIIGELTLFLRNLDPAAEVQKVLTGLEFDVHVKVGVDRKKPVVTRKKTDGKKTGPTPGTVKKKPAKKG